MCVNFPVGVFEENVGWFSTLDFRVGKVVVQMIDMDCLLVQSGFFLVVTIFAASKYLKYFKWERLVFGVKMIDMGSQSALQLHLIVI